MSLNTSNTNVYIIWHYCIMSQIKLHGFWKRSALTNMKKTHWSIQRIWYGIFHIKCHINPRPILALGICLLLHMWWIRNATSLISQRCNNLIRITWGCNNVCRFTWGVIWILKNGGRKFWMRSSIQPTISWEMPVPSQGHYGFHSFPVVD